MIAHTITDPHFLKVHFRVAFKLLDFLKVNVERKLDYYTPDHRGFTQTCR